MEEIKFNGCKHLDFEPNYGGCKRQLLGSGELFWIRNTAPDNPSMVQFCKQRGRLNNPEACLNEKNKQCSDYKMIQHVIESEIAEIES